MSGGAVEWNIDMSFQGSGVGDIGVRGSGVDDIGVRARISRWLAYSRHRRSLPAGWLERAYPIHCRDGLQPLQDAAYPSTPLPYRVDTYGIGSDSKAKWKDLSAGLVALERGA